MSAGKSGFRFGFIIGAINAYDLLMQHINISNDQCPRSKVVDNLGKNRTLGL